MTEARDDDRRKPLWATSLADEARPGDDVRIHRYESSADPEPAGDDDGVAPGARGNPAVRRAAAVLLVALVVAIAAVVAEGNTLVRTVPSAWGAITMTCDVVRIEEAPRVIERFTCRATGGGTLPAGRYRSPGISWNSDIDRRRAIATDIRITRGGALTGWALY